MILNRKWWYELVLYVHICKLGLKASCEQVDTSLGCQNEYEWVNKLKKKGLNWQMNDKKALDENEF